MNNIRLWGKSVVPFLPLVPLLASFPSSLEGDPSPPQQTDLVILGIKIVELRFKKLLVFAVPELCVLVCKTQQLRDKLKSRLVSYITHDDVHTVQQGIGNYALAHGSLHHRSLHDARTLEMKTERWRIN